MRTDMLFGVEWANSEKMKGNFYENFLKMALKEKFGSGLDIREVELGDTDLTILHVNVDTKDQHKHDKGDEKLPSPAAIEELMDEKDIRHYYITAPVLQMCQKIKIKDTLNLDWIAGAKDGKCQFNFGNHFIRYQKGDNRVTVLSMTLIPSRAKEDAHAQYAAFELDLAKKTGTSPMPQSDLDIKNPSFMHDKEYARLSTKLFFQLLTFIELAEVEQVFVKPGQKHGTKKSEDNLYNTSKYPVTIVNTAWNKIISTEGFSVDGHLRMQAYGPKHGLRRPVWIDPFHKKGYNLNAHKLRHEKRKGFIKPISK